MPSQVHLIEGDRQIADAGARRMIHSVGDGCLKVLVASNPSAGTTPPNSSRSRARSFRAASQIADPDEAVPDEPPAPPACGKALSPISSRIRSGGTSSASAAIWVSAVQAPVLMSAAAMRTA